MITKDQVKPIVARVLQEKKFDLTSGLEELVTVFLETFRGGLADASVELKVRMPAMREEVKQALLGGFLEALAEHFATDAKPTSADQASAEPEGAQPSTAGSGGT